MNRFWKRRAKSGIREQKMWCAWEEGVIWEGDVYAGVCMLLRAPFLAIH